MSNSASEGKIVSKTQGQSLTDHKGELIKFEEQKDGTYKGKGSESDGNTFEYTLEPVGEPQYTVRVVKTPKSGQNQNVNESGQKTVGSTFKDSDKTKGEFVQEYGLPAAGKQQTETKKK